MFSGIVEAVGTIGQVRRQSGGVRFTIRADLAGELKASESISVSGACLTVVAATRGVFDVEVVPETISKTSFARLREGSRVNLERPVRLQDRLGGHLVSGHVDGVGEVVSRSPEGQGLRLAVRPPAGLDRYLVYKGSVCVEGVSLTVAAVKPVAFEIALIPYTLEHTTLGEVEPGSPVNLEADLIAKYVERLMREDRGDLFVRRDISLDDLDRMGSPDRS